MAFKKGQSGNPAGKRPGTRHKATLEALELLEGDLKAITKVCIEKAKGGDLLACKLILDKLIPNRRERPVNLKVPKVETAAEIPKALGAILEAVAQGTLTPGEGQSLAAMLEAYRKGLEMADLEARVAALEKKT